MDMKVKMSNLRLVSNVKIHIYVNRIGTAEFLVLSWLPKIFQPKSVDLDHSAPKFEFESHRKENVFKRSICTIGRGRASEHT